VFVATGQRRPHVPLLLSTRRVEIGAGETARLEVEARLVTFVHAEAATGTLTLTPVGGVAVRVPWAVVLRSPADLLGPLALSRRAFAPSEAKPAVVVVRAGRVVRSSHGNEVIPVLRMDVELSTPNGRRIGLLARLRDLLPGRYAFGLTGRGPSGRVLASGRYRLRIVAWPTGGGPPTSRSVRFRIR
jgi:hypothetical protein